MSWLVLSALASVPWVAIRVVGLFGPQLVDAHAQPYLVSALTGVGIMGAAYLLSVGAEVAQLDVSRSLALAFLALVAILPEYAVDMVFAWKGGADPTFIAKATANMTGANRLLIGLFWPVVVFVFALRHRRDGVTLTSPFRLEVFFLLLATAYSFSLPFRRHISLVDFVLLSAMFGWYAFRASRAHKEEEVQLEGVGAAIGYLPRRKRRRTVLLMFVWAAVGIAFAAEPFAVSLIEAGGQLFSGFVGREEAEFLAVQWVAPFASEAPELVVATLFALKALPESALGSLISSKVNQWTLLIGALPLVYSISHAWHGGGFALSMPLDPRQVEEIFLTSAQSLLAAVLLADLALSVRDAWLLLALFLGQFFIPVPEVRYAFAIAYLALAVLFFAIDGRRRRALVSITATRGADLSRG